MNDPTTGDGSVAIVAATIDRFGDIAAVDARNFGLVYSEDDIAASLEVIDVSRFRIAVEGDTIVGLGGSYALPITLPGGEALPMTAITWVSTSVTHRRRGVLRRLMDALHADGAERGEPISGLAASEGGIYERFGYGVSTTIAITEIDPRLTRVRDEYLPPPGSVHLVAPSEAVGEMVERYDRYRRRQVGELGRDECWIRRQIRGWGDGAVVALHADGYAAWKVTADWNGGHPAHELRLFDLVAATDDAHAALWATVLSVDLVRAVRCVGLVAADDPLRYLLTDPREVRTTDWNDHVWLRPVDIPTCFEARAYRVDDRLVLGIDGRTWSVSGDGCRPSDDPVDLVLEPSAVGPLLLGGVRASTLARGRRLRPTDDRVLARADAFFGWDPLPHCRTAF